MQKIIPFILVQLMMLSLITKTNAQKLSNYEKIKMLELKKQSAEIINIATSFEFYLPEIEQCNILKEKGINDYELAYILKNRIKLNNEAIEKVLNYRTNNFPESVIIKFLNMQERWYAYSNNTALNPGTHLPYEYSNYYGIGLGYTNSFGTEWDNALDVVGQGFSISFDGGRKFTKHFGVYMSVAYSGHSSNDENWYYSIPSHTVRNFTMNESSYYSFGNGIAGIFYEIPLSSNHRFSFRPGLGLGLCAWVLPPLKYTYFDGKTTSSVYLNIDNNVHGTGFGYQGSLDFNYKFRGFYLFNRFCINGGSIPIIYSRDYFINGNGTSIGSILERSNFSGWTYQVIFGIARCLYF